MRLDASGQRLDAFATLRLRRLALAFEGRQRGLHRRVEHLLRAVGDSGDDLLVGRVEYRQRGGQV